MRLAWKPVVSLSFLTTLAIWLAGCGPTNGLAPLTGEYLYVANSDGIISDFSINTTTGALTAHQSYPATHPSQFGFLSLAVHPTNEFIYMTDYQGGDILGFDIGDGVFSGSLFGQNTDTPLSLSIAPVITPNGAFLYALSFTPSVTAESLAEYSINLVPGTPSLPNEQNGALTSIGSVNLQQPVGVGIAIDASGGYVYVPEASNVLEYAIQADGTLSAIGSLTPTSNTRSSLGHIVTTQPTSKTECAYAFDDGLQVVWEMSIDTSNGSLSLVGNEPVNALESPETAVNLPEIRTDPNQKFIYVTSGEPGTIFVLAPTSISKEGSNSCAMALTSQLTVDVDGYVDIAIEPSGYFAYVTDSQPLPATVPGTVLELSINQTTGALTPIARVNAETPTNLDSGPYFPITTH